MVSFFCPYRGARDVCRMYTCADFLNFRTLSPREWDSHSIESTLSETPPVNQREVRLNVNWVHIRRMRYYLRRCHHSALTQLTWSPATPVLTQSMWSLPRRWLSWPGETKCWPSLCWMITIWICWQIQELKKTLKSLILYPVKAWCVQKTALKSRVNVAHRFLIIRKVVTIWLEKQVAMILFCSHFSIHTSIVTLAILSSTNSYKTSKQK
jgi:hypothetical protein